MGLVDPAEQVGGRNLQSTRQLEDGLQRRFPLAVLDSCDRRLVKPGGPTKLLLRQPLELTDARYVGGEGRAGGLWPVGHRGSFATDRRGLPANPS